MLPLVSVDDMVLPFIAIKSILALPETVRVPFTVVPSNVVVPATSKSLVTLRESALTTTLPAPSASNVKLPVEVVIVLSSKIILSTCNLFKKSLSLPSTIRLP